MSIEEQIEITRRRLKSLEHLADAERRQPKTIICQHCLGKIGERTRCTHCDGSGGRYTDSLGIAVGAERPQWIPCMNCAGRGYLDNIEFHLVSPTDKEEV